MLLPQLLFFDTEKKKKFQVLRKSLMRSGHVRAVQTHLLFIQMLTVVPESVRDPRVNGGGMIISVDTFWSTSAE